MSLRTLPILFLNLGGEMLYILDQRLRAQGVLPEKATKGQLLTLVLKVGGDLLCISLYLSVKLLTFPVNYSLSGSSPKYVRFECMPFPEWEIV